MSQSFESLYAAFSLHEFNSSPTIFRQLARTSAYIFAPTEIDFRNRAIKGFRPKPDLAEKGNSGIWKIICWKSYKGESIASELFRNILMDKFFSEGCEEHLCY